MKWSEHKKTWINQGIFLGVMLAVCVALFYGCRAEGAEQQASVTLAWDANTEPDIAGYRIYYGTPSGTFDTVKNCGNTTNTTISALLYGRTYAFYATCYNTSGLESEPSNVVTYTVPGGISPTEPRNLRIEL